MKIGIVGLGSIGQMLIKGFSKSKVADASQLFVYNRTRAKSEQFQAQWPFVICEDLQEVCKRSDILFLCTKPLDLYQVLDEVVSYTPHLPHLVSVAAGVSLAHLSSVYDGPISKVIPSVTSQVLRGVSLFACNEKVAEKDRQQLLTLLGAIGDTAEVAESAIETATIVTSSGPGLIAGILEQFAQAAARKSPELSIDLTRRMLVETMLGTATLLASEQLRFDQLISQVATKGGITEEGLHVLGKILPQGFDELFQRSQAKHDALREKINEQFTSGR